MGEDAVSAEEPSDELGNSGEAYEWAIVEVFGHRRHAGRVREEERFGAKMLRIDVPNRGSPDEHGWSTHFYGGAAIFSFSLTDEATALRINKPYDAPSRTLLPASGAEDDFENMEF